MKPEKWMLIEGGTYASGPYSLDAVLEKIPNLPEKSLIIKEKNEPVFSHDRMGFEDLKMHLRENYSLQEAVFCFSDKNEEQNIFAKESNFLSVSTNSLIETNVFADTVAELSVASKKKIKNTDCL